MLNEAGLTNYINSSGFDNKGEGRIELSSDLIQASPKFLGTADPINLMKFLPGVQTLTDFQSGIHICGGEDSHNMVSISGVPVFGAKHLLGLFSVFNPSHYSRTEIARTAKMTSNRIGGMIEMSLPDTCQRAVSGELAVGLLAAQGNLKFKAGKRASVCLSARQSFLNLIYGKWMKLGQDPMRYSFGDYNALIDFFPSKKDRISLDLYYSRDNATITENYISADIVANWSNALAAVHWKHIEEDWSMSNSLFFSGFFSNLNMEQKSLELYVPSNLKSLGYKGKAQYKNLTVGADISLYGVKPLSPRKSGSFKAYDSEELQQGTETSVFAEYKTEFPCGIELGAGLKGTVFIDSEKKPHLGISPRLNCAYNAYEYGKLSLNAGYGQQYLFHTGMTNSGLPVEFWFLAGKHSAPQTGIWADLDYTVSLFKGQYNLSTGLYARRLYNQVEYRGSLYDFLSASYALDEFLLKGRGFNYGASLMVQKVSGSITGWISYNFGRALRTFDHPDYPGIYPASHERIHELNALCCWKWKRWNISGTFVFTSGAPFTAPDYAYFSSGNVILRYGDYNSSRMRPYIRMDLSAGYTVLEKGTQRGEVSISCYNLFGIKNDVMYRIFVDEKGFCYRPVSSFLRFIPSINYTHKF